VSVVRTWAVALVGLDATVVEVEADLSRQLPDFRIIGLPDKTLAEAVQRVHNACANCELALPRRRITVNLSPASLPKHGSGFDVAIAVAALATDGLLAPASVARTAHLGELGLDGRLRPVPGVLPAVVAAAAAGLPRIVVPWANRAEAELVSGIEIVGAAALDDVARLHGAEIEAHGLEPIEAAADRLEPVPPPDLSEVIGQREAVDALVVAAAGGHNILMTGPPGAGKTMLARRLPGILPPLDEEQALAVASVRSLSGTAVVRLDRTPPFEAPHHTVSVAALVGGGSRVVRPGAVARASEGVLFLDEAAEYTGGVIDALRQPLESGAITIHRSGFTATFPARFQLVLATNPCPCGNYGVRGSECGCPPAAIRRYLGRLSGPLLDRVDIEVAMTRVTVASSAGHAAVTSAEARARVVQARGRTARRLLGTAWRTNAAVPGPWLRQGPFAPPSGVRRPLDDALSRGALTLRGYDRVLRVAWTLADLDGRDALRMEDIGRALFLKKGIRG
jgi:magnesium chelatase family protein